MNMIVSSPASARPIFSGARSRPKLHGRSSGECDRGEPAGGGHHHRLQNGWAIRSRWAHRLDGHIGTSPSKRGLSASQLRPVKGWTDAGICGERVPKRAGGQRAVPVARFGRSWWRSKGQAARWLMGNGAARRAPRISPRPISPLATGPSPHGALQGHRAFVEDL